MQQNNLTTTGDFNCETLRYPDLQSLHLLVKDQNIKELIDILFVYQVRLALSSLKKHLSIKRPTSKRRQVRSALAALRRHHLIESYRNHNGYHCSRQTCIGWLANDATRMSPIQQSWVHDPYTIPSASYPACTINPQGVLQLFGLHGQKKSEYMQYKSICEGNYSSVSMSPRISKSIATCGSFKIA